MMVGRFSFFRGLVLGLLGFSGWIGCGPADPHAGHDHASHDHASHDHASHDHASHDHAGHDHDQPAEKSADEPPPVNVPPTYPEAVARIEVCRAAIVAALDVSRPHDAHGPLDEADAILPRLVYLAQAAGLSRRQQETVNLTARELRQLFDDVHAAIDEVRAPPRDKLAGPAQELLTRLQTVTQRILADAPPATTDEQRTNSTSVKGQP